MGLDYRDIQAALDATHIGTTVGAGQAELMEFLRDTETQQASVCMHA